MHVGYGVVFKNLNKALPDAEVHREEIRRLAETRTSSRRA
jgi:hypothetical protein